MNKNKIIKRKENKKKELNKDKGVYLRILFCIVLFRFYKFIKNNE